MLLGRVAGDRLHVPEVRFFACSAGCGRQVDRPDKASLGLRGGILATGSASRQSGFDKTQYKRLTVRCLASPIGIKGLESAFVCAPRGVVLGDRQHVPKAGVQPNENEGVKVGSTCVSAILCAHHQPSWALGEQVIMCGVGGLLATRRTSRVGELLGLHFRVACDKLNAPVGHL